MCQFLDSLYRKIQNIMNEPCILDPGKSITRYTLTHKVNLSGPTVFSQSFQAAWELSKLQTKLERVTQSNIESLSALKIKVQNKTKKELKNTVLELQNQFQQDVLTIKLDYDKMKEDISDKTRKITQLGGYCIEQNALNYSLKLEEKLCVEFEKNYFKKSLKEMNEDLKIFQLQLDCIKEINAEYAKEVQTALTKLNEVDNEIKKIHMANQATMQVLKQDFDLKNEEIMKERDKFQSDFSSFYTRITQEIEIRTVIDQRQTLFIEQLKQQIKDSKIILQNPRMRIRVHQKLKETSKLSQRRLSLPQHT